MIDHKHTREIVCPHCGHIQRDSCEFGNGGEEDGEDECGECGEKFSWSRIITVAYSTEKIDSDENEEESIWDRDDHGDDAWCHDPDMGARG